MEQNALIPNLFRTEYQKIAAVLCYRFGIEHMEVAEDIVSDTFLTATETWAIKGVPDNPVAWLYTVAKNKTKNHLKRNNLFEQQISADLKYSAEKEESFDIDLSLQNIADSQLAMIFAVCNPVISTESQIALALNLLCGFGIQEIADAFLSNKEVIYKRINRAKEKLKEANIPIRPPGVQEIHARLDTVLTTLYLLFSEGYYSTSQQTTIRKEFCAEAMRLTYLLAENKLTNQPAVNALLALMCFHVSRFDARMDDNGEMVLYKDQDETRWNRELIEKGSYYLNLASTGNELTRYHLEAGIAYWHTIKEDSPEKWEQILLLYDHLLQTAYSPIAALNRIYALSKVQGKPAAIEAAEQLQLTDNYFYYTLLGNLYADSDTHIAQQHFQQALSMASSPADKSIITRNLQELST